MRRRLLPAFDEALSSAALVLMMLIPLVEIALRPLFGLGIENAPSVVQHLGLIVAMFGAILAERGGHLNSLGAGLAGARHPLIAQSAERFANALSALLCGLLAEASLRFVTSEIDAAGGALRTLAYGLPVWWVQAAMPLGFAILGLQLGARCASGAVLRAACGLALTAAGWAFGHLFDGASLPLMPFALLLGLALIAGAPIFAVLGGLALALFWQEGQPLAAVPLSHYQITVNPSLPALPLFTLAGLLFAHSGAAGRLGTLFTALFGGGIRGSAIAAACLCSFFTALTGGSGVTILALGGLLLPLLTRAGLPEKKGIGLVTSASALGVLLPPSVPLIMYAIIARVPINHMLVAGLLPAAVMVFFLLVFGRFLHRGAAAGDAAAEDAAAGGAAGVLAAARAAIWELLAPVVAIVSLASGIATPTESAALTAAYALATQALIHREIDAARLRRCLAECGRTIGGVMLIIGMALALTNYLIDAGIPEQAVAAIQAWIPNKWVFLIALNAFLLVAGALMEIFAALVVLVPLLLPVALGYGIDPIHFGVILLANLEMGFLCPPAGMNIFFASAMFKRPFGEVASSVLPALLAMFCGALAISWLPFLSTWLPGRLD